MSQTLAEVLERSSDFLGALDRNGKESGELFGYNGSIVDAVVVLPDDVAKRYYEAVYLFNTHFMPHGLPGCGVATGDFITHEDKNFLMLHLDVMVGNMEALHLFRPHEPKFREWNERKLEYANQVKEFISTLSQFDPDYLGLEELKNAKEWNVTTVGWQWVGTPDPKFVDALLQANTKLLESEKEGSTTIAQTAAKLAEELRAYTEYPKTMWDIRKKITHKGVPFIDHDMLSLSSPTFSGRASLHNKGASDDLMHALPNSTDLFMVAGQTSWATVKHFGGGQVQGENFVMLIPKTMFFPKVQEMLDNDQSFMAVWEEVLGKENPMDSLMTWFEKTRPLKEEVIKQVVPQIVLHNVLGFSVNFNKMPHIALLRPIISESVFRANEELINNKRGLRKIYKNSETLLVQMGNEIGQLKSVFNTAA